MSYRSLMPRSVEPSLISLRMLITQYPFVTGQRISLKEELVTNQFQPTMISRCFGKLEMQSNRLQLWKHAIMRTKDATKQKQCQPSSVWASPQVSQQVVRISRSQVLASTTKPSMSRLMKLPVLLLVTRITVSIVKFRKKPLPQSLISPLLANMVSEECSGIKTIGIGKQQSHKLRHLPPNLKLVTEKDPVSLTYSKVGLFLQPQPNTDFTWRAMTTAN